MFEAKFQLVGEELCLDFTNTVGGWRGGSLTENLNSYHDLLSWGVQAGSISAEYAEHLLNAANAHPDEAETVLAHAIALRETLFRIFNAAAHAQLPQADDLALLNVELARAMSHVQLEPHGDHFHWAWHEDPNDLSAVWWAVLRSAADLLTTPDRLQWVHQCGNDHCDWLFVDTTKNHSRRWCDMKSCGNLHKVRKHRQRQQSTNE